MAKEPSRISRVSFYFKGKKLGISESGDMTTNDNGEDHITDDGWTMSDGTTTSELKVNTISTVDGRGEMLLSALKNKEFVTAQIDGIEGRVRTVNVRCVTETINWDNKTGAAKGSYTFRGGEPTIS